MNFIFIQQVGAIITGLLALLAIFSPSSVAKIVSIKAQGKLGVSEVRATYGGFLFGLAAFTLYSQEHVAYLTLGFGWVSAATIRLCSCIVDDFTVKNIGGVIFELIIGLLCLSSLVS